MTKQFFQKKYFLEDKNVHTASNGIRNCKTNFKFLHTYILVVELEPEIHILLYTAHYRTDPEIGILDRMLWIRIPENVCGSREK